MFEFGYLYDNKITNMQNDEVIYLTIINELMRFKSKVYGLNENL